MFLQGFATRERPGFAVDDGGRGKMMVNVTKRRDEELMRVLEVGDPESLEL